MASGSKTVIYAALVGNAAIAVTKFIAAGISGSSAMLSEGIHSLVDTGNQVLLLWGLRQGQKPPDDRFPFGHGKEVYFWSFVVAIMIFAVGSGVAIYEGVKHVLEALDPAASHEIGDPTMNYIVLGLAIVFEGVAWWMAWKEFAKHKGQMGSFEAVREGKDPTMFVVLFEDSAAMAGLLVALVGIVLVQVTHMPVFDGIASVVIGLILGGVAVWLAVETKGLLIGEAASTTVRDGIKALLEATPGVSAVNEVVTMHMGPQTVIAAISVDFAGSLSCDDVERTVSELTERIKGRFEQVSRVFIEAECAVRHAEAARAAAGGAGG